MPKVHFSPTRVEQLLNTLNITKNDLALLMDCSTATISNYLHNGTGSLSLSGVYNLLQISPDVLSYVAGDICAIRVNRRMVNHLLKTLRREAA